MTSPTIPVSPITSTHRHVSSTTHHLSGNYNDQQSPTDLHSLYHEQMKEISSEREAIFGPSDPISESHDMSHAAKAYFPSNDNGQQQSVQTPTTPTAPPTLPPGWDAEEAYAEREALFQFSAEEKSAWTNHTTTGTTSIQASARLELIREAMQNNHRKEQSTASNTSQSTPFTHLNQQGDGVSMVDVGNKQATRRIAKARSVVVFPPEVLSAFEVTKKDMIGPKGPIFETAKLAGIMGAK